MNNTKNKNSNRGMSNNSTFSVSFKNHGKWTLNPRNAFTSTEIRQLSGLPTRAKMSQHIAGFLATVEKIRKQPAKLIAA